MPRIRALLDTNLYINLLMSPEPDGTAVDLVVEAGAAGRFDLLLPDDLVLELSTVVDNRPQVSSRVSRRQLDALLDHLRTFAIVLPPLAELPPSVSRDPHDDYLLALTAIHAADFLVTRDRDLLDLGKLAWVTIVDPAAFLDLLHSWPE